MIKSNVLRARLAVVKFRGQGLVNLVGLIDAVTICGVSSI